MSSLHIEKPGSKYQNTGMYNLASFQDIQIPDGLKRVLVDNSNNSITQGTWSAYRTALNKLISFSAETGHQTNFPLSENTILAFAAWVLSTGVAALTLETYLSGIRMAHLTLGLKPPQLRTPLVTAVLQGKKNKDNMKKRAGHPSTRLPITPDLLKLMKLDLAKSDKKGTDKKMIWAAATIAFAGGLRGGEFLSKDKLTFDPATTLKEKDVTLDSFVIRDEKTEVLKLKLKAEKQNRSASVTIVDIYPSDSSICPVRAYKKWTASKSFIDPHLPAFRFDNGENLTLTSFNKILKTIFCKHLTGINGCITSHSFRIGLASMLGSLGFADEQVMAAGRWSSRAFTAYLKLPRSRRLEMARAISRISTK